MYKMPRFQESTQKRRRGAMNKEETQKELIKEWEKWEEETFGKNGE